MVALSVSVVIDAPPAVVWRDVSKLASHVEWMHDARGIRFTSTATSGPGTTFDCVTAVGPLRVVDRMRVTEWEPERTIGVDHHGAVSGEGRFSLRPVGRDRTEFRWDETLRFPWWLAGPLGALIARPILARIWRRNLAALAARF